MTNSRLKLNRLLVFHDLAIIYNKEFHDGINVIRGDHSVGKSMLFDIIYYVLGGELKTEEWKEPLNKCSDVKAEIEINNKKITLSREVSVGGKPNIRVFDGSYEQASKDSENWRNFGPTRSNNKASFSEMIFELFGWGQQKTEAQNSLTMHQILRLSYLSQSSKSTSIFREEIDKRGDSDSTRKAIAEFLLGLDDQTSYIKRQKKIQKEIELAKFKGKFENLTSMLGEYSNKTIDEIEEQISEKQEIISNLSNEKSNKLASLTDGQNSSIVQRRQELIDLISNLTQKAKELASATTLIKSEIIDCELFAKWIGKIKVDT